MTTVEQDEGRFLDTGDEAGTAPGDRKFRPDVEGLRAVAVLLVVLYHADIPWLTGGFVGVDVFFVLSGFVITGLLLRERATTGTTKLLNFYGRRSRRILPAATLVIMLTVLASYHWLGFLTGDDTAQVGRTASLFYANFHFISTGTNYLASQAPPSALQNFWSLSVEEQFYVLYPTLFIVTALAWSRVNLRLKLSIFLVVSIVASFTWSVVQTSSNGVAAYFSPFTRAWETPVRPWLSPSSRPHSWWPAVLPRPAWERSGPCASHPFVGSANSRIPCICGTGRSSSSRRSMLVIRCPWQTIFSGCCWHSAFRSFRTSLLRIPSGIGNFCHALGYEASVLVPFSSERRSA
ncbi:MAG: acyltransferase [Acidimicrobiales bacterium]